MLSTSRLLLGIVLLASTRLSEALRVKYESVSLENYIRDEQPAACAQACHAAAEERGWMCVGAKFYKPKEELNITSRCQIALLQGSLSLANIA